MIGPLPGRDTRSPRTASAVNPAPSLYDFTSPKEYSKAPPEEARVLLCPATLTASPFWNLPFTPYT